MSQVAKSASAFVRAFLAILALELEDMVVRLFRPLKLAGLHGDRWTVCLGISVDVRCPAWRLAWRTGICPFAEAAKRALDGFAGACLEEKSRRVIYIVALLSMFEITHVIFSSATAKPRRSKGSKLDAEDAPISRPIHRKRSFTPG